jgi:hypothetical protein
MEFERESNIVVDRWVEKTGLDVNEPAGPIDLSALRDEVSKGIASAVSEDVESVFCILCPLCALGNVPQRRKARYPSQFPWVHTLSSQTDGQTIKQCEAAQLREWIGLEGYGHGTLAAMISMISQRVYHEIWFCDVEFNLWTALGDYLSGSANLPETKRYFGFESVTERELATLKRLSDQTGGWVYWDTGLGRARFVTLEEWEAIYQHQYDRYTVGEFDEIMKTVPENEISQLPEDASEHLDRYIYGGGGKAR